MSRTSPLAIRWIAKKPKQNVNLTATFFAASRNTSIPRRKNSAKTSGESWRPTLKYQITLNIYFREYL